MLFSESSKEEVRRIETLRRYGVLDTLPEQAFDDLVAVTAEICGMPIALISLIDTNRQWFKARFGLDVIETPREGAFCEYALKQSNVFVVPDAWEDERFAQSPMVTGEPHIRFYAGAPLFSPEKVALGTLSVIDRVPRTLTSVQLQTLQVLARQVMTHLELHRQMKDLRLSEERFSSAFEYAPIGMALVSIDGEWLKVNQALCALLGYTTAEFMGKTFQEMTYPDDLESDLDHVRDLLAGRMDSYHMEKRYFHKAGYLVWAKLGVSLVKDALGTPLYFISQIQDITDLKEATFRQQELTRQAQAGEKAKSDFLATMSHEIRTPLNGVIGMTSILADTELNETQRECVSTISTSGESLLAVINDILDYSKIEAGRLELESRSFNLRQCVEEAFDLFAASIRSKRLEVNVLIGPDVPSHVLGDTMRLRQILVNLIGNAIKFTAKGEVVVSVDCKKKDETGCHLDFAVADTGIGISKEGMDRLFRAFQQGDTSTTRRFGGTGLGLIISKRLTEMMGGDIRVESELGSGSTFLFTVVLPASAQVGTNEMSNRIKQLKSLSVLIVDDNATNRRMLEMQLKMWGVNATFASTGRKAVELVGRQTFDVALLDLNMPKMDGVTLARRIRNEGDLPLILLSSSGLAITGEDAPLFQSQILKPIKQSYLLNALLKVSGVEGETATKPAAASFEADLASRHPLRILLAEDNVVNQRVGLSILGRMGYTADVVGNGKQALAALDKATYDVILMDIQMPEMNGTEAAKMVRERLGAKSPSIIALTAEALEGDKERFLGIGFDDYLSKPLQVQQLQEILKKVKAGGER
jgi:PAS domain S-box-containing protein